MLNFLIIANDEYIKYAKSLIYSISKYHDDYRIFLYLINPSQENLDILSKAPHNLVIRIINKELSQNVETIYSEEAAYSANIRGQILYDLVLAEDLNNLIYLDADSIIKSSIKKINKIPYDISFFVRPESEKKSSYFSGLISLNITPNTKERILRALDFYKNRIEEYGLTTWFSDQKAIEDFYKKYVIMKDIDFEFLSHKYFDWGFNKNSKIWMGKGKSKQHQDYIELQKMYEIEFTKKKQHNNYLIVTNDDYIKYTKSLIYSISQSDPDYKIFLYVINPETENFKTFRKKLKAYNVVYKVIEEKLSKEKNKARIILYSEESAFSANIRGKLLKDLIKQECLDNITYIDADSLVRKTIEKICPNDTDLTFFMRAEDTCSSGLISFNITSENRQKILEMLSYYQSKIEEYGLTTWFSDQIALKDVYHKFIVTNELKFNLLPKIYFDWTCLNESSIWMGKGKKKEKDSYINLQKEYESLF